MLQRLRSYFRLVVSKAAHRAFRLNLSMSVKYICLNVFAGRLLLFGEFVYFSVCLFFFGFLYCQLFYFCWVFSIRFLAVWGCFSHLSHFWRFCPLLWSFCVFCNFGNFAASWQIFFWFCFTLRQFCLFAVSFFIWQFFIILYMLLLPSKEINSL